MRLIGISGYPKIVRLEGTFDSLVEEFLRPRSVTWSIDGQKTCMWLSNREYELLLGQRRANGDRSMNPLTDQVRLFWALTGLKSPFVGTHRPDNHQHDKNNFAALADYKDGFEGKHLNLLNRCGAWTLMSRPQAGLNAFIAQVQSELVIPPDDPGRLRDNRFLNDKKNIRGLAYLAGMEANLEFMTIGVPALGVFPGSPNTLKTKEERISYAKLWNARYTKGFVPLYQMAKDCLENSGIYSY